MLLEHLMARPPFLEHWQWLCFYIRSLGWAQIVQASPVLFQNTRCLQACLIGKLWPFVQLNASFKDL